MSNIIFLDIDGVLNHEMFYRKRHEEGFNPENYPLTEFCPEAVKNLNVLIEKGNAVICVSSSWRLGRTIEELQELLNSVGVKGNVVGRTCSKLNRSKYGETVRGDEIKHWFECYPELDRDYMGRPIPNNYVILDDDNDMSNEQKTHFIHVDRWFGLTEKDVEKAIQILKTPV